MAASTLAPALSFFSALTSAPLRPWHTFVRQTEARWRPPLVEPHRPTVCRAQAQVIESGGAVPGERAVVLRERGHGRTPTIVLGGLVPDATEQVFLLRRFLLKSGDVYYVNYPPAAFSLELLGAQLSDLVAELELAGQAPVVFAVSFGAGIVVDWLRRARAAAREIPLGGLVLVSPVTCVADLIAPGAAKASTLVGRALKPYLDPAAEVNEAVVEKSRAVFLRMFEAGAQNKAALRLLMTPAETERLRGAVLATIRGIPWRGAHQRVCALGAMPEPTSYFSSRVLPLTAAPALVLFAEKEDAVLDAAAPVRLAFESATRAYFPNGTARRIHARPGGAPVQHASLIFHVFEFLPALQAFYQRARRPLALAA